MRLFAPFFASAALWVLCAPAFGQLKANSANLHRKYESLQGGKPIALKPGDKVTIGGSDKVYIVGEDGTLLIPVGAKVTVMGKPRQRVVDEALKYLGTPCNWGGNDLEKGIDTSHFVAAVFARSGMPSVPPPISSQERQGKIVHWRQGPALRGGKRITFSDPSPSLDVLRPGDRIIIQHPPLNDRAGGRHTGVYIGEYNGRFGHFKHAVVHAGSHGVAVVSFNALWKDYRYTLRD